MSNYSPLASNDQQQGGGPAPEVDDCAFKIHVRKASYPITSDIIRAAVQSFGEVESCDVNPSERPDREGFPAAVGKIVFKDAGAASQAAAALKGRPIYPDCCFLSLYPVNKDGTSVISNRGRGGLGGAGRGGMMMNSGGMGRGRGFGGPGHHGHHHHHHHHGGMMMQQNPQMMMHHGHHQHHHHHHGMMMHQHQHHYGGHHQQYQHHHQQQIQAPAYFIMNGISDTLPLKNLFTLLENYAVVYGIRRQQRPPNMAVVLFESAEEGMSAARMISGVEFYGMKLDLRPFPGFQDQTGFAPPSTVAEGSPEADPSKPECSTFDFTRASHRRAPKPKNPYHQARPPKHHEPCKNVFIGNLLPEIGDEQLKTHFNELALLSGKEPFAIEEYERYSPMNAVISVASLEAAVEFEMLFHGSCIKERFLRVTFSGFAPFRGPPSSFSGTAPNTAHRTSGAPPSAYPPQHQNQNQQQQQQQQQEEFSSSHVNNNSGDQEEQQQQ